MICPIDYRYGREIVKNIFSEENRLRKMIEVELALLKALEKLGAIPPGESAKVEKIVDLVSVEEVKLIERKTKHDVMALVEVLYQKSQCKYVHLGATSNDIVDTATALQLVEFFNVLEEDLKMVMRTLATLSVKYKNTIMLGRTHGQPALPITFGWKMAVYISEFIRHFERMREIRKRILGKMMGAVGTAASFRELGIDVFKLMEELEKMLGIGFDRSPTQIVSRDIYVEIVNFLANIATTAEKIATEIRNLQRAEIGEVMEYFESEQVGSSTMPQKRNPIVSENICGLARIVRGFVIPMYESAVLWHERDLSNSSAERFIIPHVCVLVDDILNKLNNVLGNLVVNEERMKDNVLAFPEIMSEKIMIELVKKGYSRQDAHRIVREMASKNIVKEYAERFGDSPERMFDPYTYLGEIDRIISEVLKKLKELNC